LLLYLVQRCTAWARWVPAWAAPARKTTCKLVTDEVLHPIGKIQPLLIRLNLP